MTKSEEIKALLAEVKARADRSPMLIDYVTVARDVPRLVAALEAAVVGLEEFTKPWPLDSNPGMTVKDAFDLFGRSLQHANEALAQVAKELGGKE